MPFTVRLLLFTTEECVNSSHSVNVRSYHGEQPMPFHVSGLHSKKRESKRLREQYGSKRRVKAGIEMAAELLAAHAVIDVNFVSPNYINILLDNGQVIYVILNRDIAMNDAYQVNTDDIWYLSGLVHQHRQLQHQNQNQQQQQKNLNPSSTTSRSNINHEDSSSFEPLPSELIISHGLIVEDRSVIAVHNSKSVFLLDQVTEQKIRRDFPSPCIKFAINCTRQLICGQTSTHTAVLAHSSRNETGLFLELSSSFSLDGRHFVSFEFSKRKPDTLHVIEVEADTKCWWTTYECTLSQVRKEKDRYIPTTSEAVCAVLSPTEEHCLLGCADGTLRIFNKKFKHLTVNRTMQKHIPYLMKWNHSGTLIAVAFKKRLGKVDKDSNGSIEHHLCFFDCGLNIMQVVSNNGEPINSINPTTFLPHCSGKFTSFEFMPSNVNYLADGTICSDIHAYFTLEGGPVGIIRLGVLGSSGGGSGDLSYGELMLHQLCHRHVKQAYSIIRNVNAMEDLFMVISVFVNHVIRRPEDSHLHEYLDQILRKYSLIFTNKKNLHSAQFKHLFKRYFRLLLRQGYLEKAFYIASLLRSPRLFAEIYQRSSQYGYDSISRAALSKCSRSFIESVSKPEQFFTTSDEFLDQVYNENQTNLERLQYTNIAALSPQDAERLGGYLEVEGRFQDAIKVYQTALPSRNTEHLELLIRNGLDTNTIEETDVTKALM